jgi:hypothetical protein
VNNLEAGMNKETKRDQVLAVVSIVVVVILIALFWENNFVLSAATQAALTAGGQLDALSLPI